jgi:type VI secretion system secreted protein VgrG
LSDQRKTELFANDNLTVHADSHTKIDGKMLGTVDTELHIKAGRKVVIEAGTELTLGAGAGWIKLDPSGVRFGGPKINLGGGGSPGNGSGANPELPENTLSPAIGTKPIFIAPVFESCLAKATKNGSPVCGSYSKK